MNETNIPWEKNPSVPKEAMPGLSLARKADSCRVPVWKRETLADGKAAAVKMKGEQTRLIGVVGTWENVR